MRRLLILTAMALTACSSDTPTAPLPAGTVEVFFSFPNQQLSVDRAGNQADIEQLTLSLGVPTLVGGSCSTNCSASSSSATITLAPGDKRSWAAWTNVTGSYTTLRIPIVLRQSAAGALRTGTSVSFGGVFNGIAATQAQYMGAYIVQLPITTTIELPLPAGSNTEGSRYTVSVNTDAILRDPSTNDLIDIPNLINYSPPASGVAAVQARLQTAFTVTHNN